MTWLDIKGFYFVCFVFFFFMESYPYSNNDVLLPPHVQKVLLANCNQFGKFDVG